MLIQMKLSLPHKGDQTKVFKGLFHPNNPCSNPFKWRTPPPGHPYPPIGNMDVMGGPPLGTHWMSQNGKAHYRLKSSMNGFGFPWQN